MGLSTAALGGTAFGRLARCPRPSRLHPLTESSLAGAGSRPRLDPAVKSSAAERPDASALTPRLPPGSLVGAIPAEALADYQDGRPASDNLGLADISAASHHIGEQSVVAIEEWLGGICDQANARTNRRQSGHRCRCSSCAALEPAVFLGCIDADDPHVVVLSSCSVGADLQRVAVCDPEDLCPDLLGTRPGALPIATFPLAFPSPGRTRARKGLACDTVVVCIESMRIAWEQVALGLPLV